MVINRPYAQLILSRDFPKKIIPHVIDQGRGHRHPPMIGNNTFHQALPDRSGHMMPGFFLHPVRGIDSALSTWAFLEFPAARNNRAEKGAKLFNFRESCVCLLPDDVHLVDPLKVCMVGFIR